jgi:hypothetical protein
MGKKKMAEPVVFISHARVTKTCPYPPTVVSVDKDRLKCMICHTDEGTFNVYGWRPEVILCEDCFIDQYKKSHEAWEEMEAEIARLIAPTN